MKKLAFIISALILTNLNATESHAKNKSLKLCSNSSGAVSVRSKCKKDETIVTLDSLKSAGIAGAQGEKGEKGDTGAPGSQGPAGVTGFETISAPGGKIVIPPCDPILNPGCFIGIPGFPGTGGVTASVSCPAGKVIFASFCPDKKVTLGAPVPGFPLPEISVLTSSNSTNGTTLNCVYTNSTGAAVEISFTPTVVCGPL